MNRTKAIDRIRKEETCTMSTDEVYYFFSYNETEPYSQCAPQNIEGIVLTNNRGEGVLDVEPDFFTK